MLLHAEVSVKFIIRYKLDGTISTTFIENFVQLWFLMGYQFHCLL